ncbi:type I secretion system permease/ATPase, partial [Vibrio splendidus]
MILCINLHLKLIEDGKKDIINGENDISKIKEMNYFDFIKKIENEKEIKVSAKFSQFKSLDKVKTPSILFDMEGLPLTLAKSNKDKCLIQRPNKETPEIISYNELNSIWNHRWLEIKQAQSRFDIAWFIPEFLQHKRILGEIFLFSFVLQILALISPLFFQVVMDKVLVHQAWSTL